MFSAVLFAQDQMAAKAMEDAARDSRQVCIYRSMNSSLSPYELTRVLNTFKPDIVFVELTDLNRALLLARTARLICREAAIIGFAESCDDEQRRQALQAGVPEVLSCRVTQGKFEQALERAIRDARPGVEDNLLAFLPAKAGSGSTTLSVNLAACMARDYEKKVLLLESDFHSGPVSVMLKLTPEYSVLDALQNASQLDGTLWSRIVMQAEGMDLLVNSKPGERLHVLWSNYHQLLQFVRPRYNTIMVDLPEVVNEATIEIVRRARKVFLVTTVEPPALVLTRQRSQKLLSRGIPPERIGVLLNRWTRSEIDVADVERFLEQPVSAVFENDYRCVRRALQEGRIIGKKSQLGRSLSAFAGKLVGLETPVQPPKASTGFFDSLFSRSESSEENRVDTPVGIG